MSVRRSFNLGPKTLWHIIREVALIFLGISLAIWFNNWNEQIKLKHTEKDVLLEIKSGLKADLKDLNINLTGHKHGIRSCDSIRKYYVKGSFAELDTLFLHIIQSRANFSSLRNTAPYEFLKSKGISIISNDSLRLAITDLYEYKYKNLGQIEMDYEPMQFNRNHTNLFWEHLKPLVDFSPTTLISPKTNPGNFERDPQFIFTLVEIRILRTVAVREYNETIARVNQIIAQIDDYLGMAGESAKEPSGDT